MIKLNQIKQNPEIISLINSSCECLRMMNYTEHGLRHASYVSMMTGVILEKLDYEERIVELGKIAGYIHDVGN
ncbi:MAG: phosphohydrolase, partial [Clostridia bacterium]|nr:phosphohydrolase [Clostridia bacterium]